jgi:hypothetical protein
MKQKINQFSKVILLYFIVVFSSCENENITTDNLNPSLSTAKIWFEEFKAKEDFQPIFKNVEYQWNMATIKTLEDGSKAITVPLVDIDQNPNYLGEKMLYLYPVEGAYLALVHELIPDGNQKSQGFDSLDSHYNGYIGTWDLRKGFIKGAKFTDGIATNVAIFRIIPDKDLKRNNTATSKLIERQLDEVIVIGSSGESSPKSIGVKTGRGDTGLQSSCNCSNTDNYFNPPGGGGGTKPPGKLPVLEEEKLYNPCDQIKKMIDAKNPTNMKPEIDWLKAKVNAAVNETESSVSVQKKLNYDGVNYDYSYDRLDSPNKFSAPVTTGGSYIGSAHSHPTDGYAMFSFQDVRLLLNTFEGASTTRKSDAFVMVVCKDKAGNTNVYNIKVDDPIMLKNKVDEVWNNPKYSRNATDDLRLEAIHFDQAKLYEKSNGNLEKSFLDQFKDFGISLYKSDTNVSYFSKLTLNSLKKVTSTPCN